MKENTKSATFDLITSTAHSAYTGVGCHLFEQMNFSQRRGLKPIRATIQKESIDDELRTALWNDLTIYYFREVANSYYDTRTDLVNLLKRLWVHYFKYKLDEFPASLHKFTKEIKEYYFRAQWNEIFDIIEFIIINYTEGYKENRNDRNFKFIELCNSTLERLISAYRIIDFLVTEITGDEEINSIEKAIADTDTISPVRTHIRRALELMTDRKSPDYRNSIKESISAVEALCIFITEDQKATLGQALNKIEKTHKIHPALKKSFTALYGYTSDSSGIRHALIEEDNLTQDDARYMLVSSTTFINYLLSKYKLK